MSNPKEIAEKIIKKDLVLDNVHSDYIILARAYLELENKHEYIHNKLLDDIEYQKSEISILKQDLDSEKRNHKIFREAAEGYLKKLKKSREVLRKALEHTWPGSNYAIDVNAFNRNSLKADDELMEES